MSKSKFNDDDVDGVLAVPPSPETLALITREHTARMLSIENINYKNELEKHLTRIWGLHEKLDEIISFDALKELIESGNKEKYKELLININNKLGIKLLKRKA